VGAIVQLVKIGDTSRADEILDAFEGETDIGQMDSDDRTRTYVLMSATDWTTATEGISQVLDRVAPEWRDHLAFRDPDAR
jgi:hypothetical protein